MTLQKKCEQCEGKGFTAEGENDMPIQVQCGDCEGKGYTEVIHINLCDNCINHIATCSAKEIVFGDDFGGDNVISCEKYRRECKHRWDEGVRTYGVQGGYLFMCLSCGEKKPGWRVATPNSGPATRIRQSKKERRRNKQIAKTTD